MALLYFSVAFATLTLGLKVTLSDTTDPVLEVQQLEFKSPSQLI
jgi:hypothetical protein